jgi:deoxyinosine 3'endonuclease (endonuclease V)
MIARSKRSAESMSIWKRMSPVRRLWYCAWLISSRSKGVTAAAPLVFPYIPGLLDFREGPAVLAAWEKAQHKPDVVMFDGQGIAHPRSIGTAAQMGLRIERPTMGVRKAF